MGPNPIDLMCKEVVELVSEYLDHALGAEGRVRFEKHLLTCPPCTAYLAQIRTTLELAGALDKAAPSEDTKLELVRMFRRWHGK